MSAGIGRRGTGAFVAGGNARTRAADLARIARAAAGSPRPDRSGPDPVNGSGVISMSTLRATDLSLLRGADPLWRRRPSGLAGEDACEPYELVAKHALPRRGFASPLGFWFAPEEDWASPPAYRVELAPPRRPGAMSHAGNGSPAVAEGRCLRVVVAGRPGSGASAEQPRMALEVAGRSARITVDETAWPEAQEAGLLAVATCWRLEALDGSLDRLTDDARATLDRRGRAAPCAGRSPALLADPPSRWPCLDPRPARVRRTAHRPGAVRH